MAQEACAVWPGVEPARSVDALLGDLLVHATAQAGSPVEGSVWARRRGTDWWLASSGDRVDRCDAAAVRADGPRSVPGEALHVPDVSQEQRWHRWREVVLGQHFRSVTVLHADLTRGDQVSLTLYGDRPESCPESVVERARRFVVQMASLVDLHATIPERSDLPGGGAGYRRRHVTVEQAVGVRMERRGCDATEALHVLTVTAAARSSTVEQVAEAVVEGAVSTATLHRLP
jgi:hypothetical protein